MFKRGTIEQIEKHLKRYGWEKFQAVPEPGEKEGMIMTGWVGSSGQPHILSIDPIAEKHVLTVRARSVVKAAPDSTPADRLSGLLLAIGAINYRLLVGDWGYDPRDGEVVFRVGIPLHADEIGYEDFELCLNVIVGAVEIDGPRLQSIVDGTAAASELLAADGLPLG
jgi:hypothetical protein